MATGTTENMGKTYTGATSGTGTDFSTKAQTEKNELVKMSHAAGERIGAMASDVSKTANEYIRTGREYVKEHPTRGIAIAAAAGLVTGGLMAIALRRRH